MPSQLHDIVSKLNRLNRLYDYAMSFSKPYRIGKIVGCYLAMKAEARLSCEMRAVDCESYKEIFVTSQILEDAAKMKREAIKNGEYENAAHYRDLEKRALRNVLSDFGIGESDKFFVRNGLIYEIP